MRANVVKPLIYCKVRRTRGVDAMLDAVPLIQVDSSPKFEFRWLLKQVLTEKVEEVRRSLSAYVALMVGGCLRLGELGAC